jgi:hypothetical protein
MPLKPGRFAMPARADRSERVKDPAVCGIRWSEISAATSSRENTAPFRHPGRLSLISPSFRGGPIFLKTPDDVARYVAQAMRLVRRGKLSASVRTGDLEPRSDAAAGFGAGGRR